MSVAAPAGVFPTGERGANQVQNGADEPVRILMLSEKNTPEIGIYPDSDKMGAFGRAPGSPDEGLELYLPQDAELDY